MKPISSNLTLEEIDQRIARTAVEAAIEIGYYLKQIRDRKLYEQAGCRDVYEYARKQYGYDKSVASRHMSRNDRFSKGGNSPELAEQYAGYGKSQLQEMISMTEEQLEQVNPDMTVREMKNLKKPEKARKSPGIPEQKAVATSQRNRRDGCLPETAPEKEQKLSAYGLPELEYPPDSLIAGFGCGKYGGVLYHCFSCHMSHCQIRKEDCYCVEAPMGNPFPCRTLLFMEQEKAGPCPGDRCQFVNHELADHAAGDGSAIPCCKECDTPCTYQCDRAAAVREKEQEKKPESGVVDGSFREVERQPEDDRDEERSDRSDLELIREELEKAKDILKLMQDAFTDHDWRVRKQKLLIGALAGFVCDLESLQNQKDHVQPVLPVLRNNDQRKAWLRNYKDWGLWYRDDNIGAEYYRYEFPNGARLIAEVYQEPETKYISAYESCHLHLVGGPKPPGDGPDKWAWHERYSRYPNSETELVEFLKEVQRGQK